MTLGAISLGLRPRVFSYEVAHTRHFRAVVSVLPASLGSDANSRAILVVCFVVHETEHIEAEMFKRQE